jgi:probable HAF family extracellular repeat protein
MRRRTSAVTLLLAFLIAATWIAPAAADVAYDFILIEAFDPNYDLREVILRDINESGLVTGSSTSAGSYTGFAWTEQTEKVVLPLTWPRGLNNLNQIVGGGTIYDLDTGESANAPATGGWPIPSLQAINDHGVAVGYSECSCSNSGRTIQSAMVWDAQNGSRTIPVAGAKELLAITNGNSAVGNIRGGSAGSEGFLYDVDAGVSVNMSDLLPPYPYSRPWSELLDLSETNVVCGRGWDGTVVRGLTWSQQAGFTFLPAIPGGMIDRVYPRGINSSGAVVGFADLTPYSPRAFIWDPQNGMRNLNDLVSAPTGFILDWALKINEQGWIVGIGHYGPGWGTSRGFVLRPTALPTGVDADLVGQVTPELRLLANPITDRLVVEFQLPHDGLACLSVFDVAGRRVARVLDGVVPAGTHTVSWNPPSSQSSGVYYLRLEAGAWSEATRFVLVR